MKTFIVAVIVMISHQTYFNEYGESKILILNDGVSSKWIYDDVSDLDGSTGTLYKVGDTIHLPDYVWRTAPDTLSNNKCKK